MERELFSRVLLEQKTVTLRYAIKRIKERVSLIKTCNNLTQSDVKKLIRELYKIASCIADVLCNYYEFKFTNEEHTLEMYDCIEEPKELQEATMTLECKLNIVGENLTSGSK